MEQKCPNCNGSGVIKEYDELDRYHVLECGQCGGGGVINDNELKPCPFCGERNINVSEAGYRSDLWFIQCEDCWATFPHLDTKQEAIEAWNRRA